jgi:hypothetical protein
MFGTGLNDYENRVYEDRRLLNIALGMADHEARKAALTTVQEAIAQSKAAGWYNAGASGEYVLKQYKSEPRFRKLWEAMRAAGVRDEDVVEWWNLPDFERRLMVRDDDAMRVGLFAHLIEEGKSPEQAARIVWEAMTVFGDPLAPPTFADDPASTMLPVEMKLRVIRWGERVQASGMKRGQEFGTMNEYVRFLACQGSL